MSDEERLNRQLNKIKQMSAITLHSYSTKLHLFDVSSEVKSILLDAIAKRSKELVVDRSAALVNNGELKLGELQ